MSTIKLDIVHIFDFKNDYELAKYSPKEDGYYMTIRCGLNGIYTCLDEWKNDHWQVGVLDDSNVIAYSKEQVSKEEVKKWANAKLEKERTINRRKLGSTMICKIN